MVYKNFRKGRIFSRKVSSSSNSDKRNNIRDTDWKEARSGKPDKSKERYSDDGNNYGLMENANDEADNAELKVPQCTLTFDTGDIYELRLFQKHACLEKELAKEREVIKLWTNSGKATQEILENGCWGSELGYSARSNSDKKNGEKTEITEPIKTDSQVKLNKVQIKTIKFNQSANNVKSIHEEGTTSVPISNLTTEKSEQVHTNSVNIGSMTQKQLKQKLKDVHMKDKRKKSRKTRNGKVGVNKNGSYVTPPNAPRKTYSNCGSTNHLANSCRKNKDVKNML
ncbi:hypothetical protein AgCh_038284 [Apium graveolens]